MTINGQRLWDHLMELSAIGKQPSGGVTRLSFSPEERAAKDLVANYMKRAGLEVREDAAGNLIGRMAGQDNDAPVLLVGSHVDSVINGGHFDGPLGVLAGVEAVQTMSEQGIVPAGPIEIIAFTDEEGARFRYGMIGSRALAGTMTSEEFEAKDVAGVSIREAMKMVGLDANRIGEARRTPGSVKAYVELHIEQGKVLESAGLQVGVVSGIAGPLWSTWCVYGEAGHAGATPMGTRKDALVGAAELIRMIEEEAAREQSVVGTVGQLQVHPGGVNIIPGEVEFTLDLRAVDESVRDLVEQRILTRAKDICNARGLHFEVTDLQRIPPVRCSPDIQEAIRSAAGDVGITTVSLMSGAGHDGMQLRDLCPVGMLFVRSKDGISHNPAEWTSQKDCAVAADVLFHTIVRLSSTV